MVAACLSQTSLATCGDRVQVALVVFWKATCTLLLLLSASAVGQTTFCYICPLPALCQRLASAK